MTKISKIGELVTDIFFVKMTIYKLLYKFWLDS